MKRVLSKDMSSADLGVSLQVKNPTGCQTNYPILVLAESESLNQFSVADHPLKAATKMSHTVGPIFFINSQLRQYWRYVIWNTTFSIRLYSSTGPIDEREIA